MTFNQWGWNAYGASKEYVAVEFAQARLDDEITDAQIDAFCWYAVERIRPVWPDIPWFLINHSELPEGANDGKTDAYPRGTAAEAFRKRIRERLP